MKTYKIAVTLPLTLWIEVEAADEQEALEKAKNTAVETPYEDWGDDMTCATYDIIKD